MAVYFVVCVKNAYEFWGIVEITDAELTLRAPLRKTIRFRYTEIVDIGIDYGWLSVKQQHWIYVGKKHIPYKYCHRINRLPINQEYMRIQFSTDVFSAMHTRLPSKWKKHFHDSVNTSLRRYEM